MTVFVFGMCSPTNYSFPESVLQITLHLLGSSLGNTVVLHTLFLEYETQISEKKNTG